MRFNVIMSYMGQEAILSVYPANQNAMTPCLLHAINMTVFYNRI